MDKIIDSNQPVQVLINLLAMSCVLLCLCYAITITFDLARSFKLYFLTGCCSRMDFAKKYGKWAIVSGSGDGIGRALLVELARRGMSVLVVDRDEGKLETTRQILLQVPECGQIETLQADLADWSEENYQRIGAAIDAGHRDIGILINSVGTMPYEMRPFLEFHRKSMTTMVNLNVHAAVHLTHMIAPGMLDRGRGLIMNVASLASSLPAPYLNLYGPTKAFIEALTYQLQMEFHSRPIDVVLLKPGPVATSLADPTNNIKESFLVMKPESYAKSVIDALPAVPNFYTGSVRHGLLRIVMEIMNMLGLFRLITNAIKRARDDHFERYDKLEGPIDLQRVTQVDCTPKQNRPLLVGSLEPNATMSAYPRE